MRYLVFARFAAVAAEDFLRAPLDVDQVLRDPDADEDDCLRPDFEPDLDQKTQTKIRII